MVYAASWPKAIHEGDGILQLYISKQTDGKQREAIWKIFDGQTKGNGYFALFAHLPPQFVEIKQKIDGKKSSFNVEGVLHVELESFKNPVTGEEQETQIHLPKGFIWQAARACKNENHTNSESPISRLTSPERMLSCAKDSNSKVLSKERGDSP